MYQIQSTTFETTGDGSKTIFHPLIGEHYHSKHGAVQESQHVFMDQGLLFTLQNFSKPTLRLLEVGFGTGLNFLLSAQQLKNHSIQLDYQGIEAYPLSLDTLIQSDYQRYVDPQIWASFVDQYESAFRGPQSLMNHIQWRLHQLPLERFKPEELVDLLYYDAFSPRHQPEMWSFEVLSQVASMIARGGIFVTYSITGQLRRDLQGLGFEVTKLAGPPGKREMLRAIKM
jgi:tRNA U34 5-methylaminomethyl-2-thiouridine-forming methyltransferase MnmC